MNAPTKSASLARLTEALADAETGSCLKQQASIFADMAKHFATGPMFPDVVSKRDELAARIKALPGTRIDLELSDMTINIGDGKSFELGHILGTELIVDWYEFERDFHLRAVFSGEPLVYSDESIELVIPAGEDILRRLCAKDKQRIELAVFDKSEADHDD
jgi:hypothetical protein